MAFAIIRGANGRRHEVDFGEDEITVSLHELCTLLLPQCQSLKRKNAREISLRAQLCDDLNMRQEGLGCQS